MKSKPIILIIDDDQDFLNDLAFLLRNDYEIFTATNGRLGLTKIREIQPDVVLLDLVLQNENGLDLLKEIKRADAQLPVLMVTEHSSIDTAVEAIKSGAENYISKNFSLKELHSHIERALKSKLDRARSELLMEESFKPYERIIGRHPLLAQIKEKIQLAAANDFTVLITGESGTGKELVARHIHKLSRRAQELFVAVNCGALPEQLIESELFGYEKGAFTGATRRKAGKFEIASAGTIFLDEIGELSLNAQVKLMRVLQNKEFERLGGGTVLQTNARIIAATNKDLRQMMQKGQFREDLFYRLEVFPIHLPPLRERKSDIPLLVDYFLTQRAAELNLPKPKIENSAIELFLNYDWPGNIRELNNVITRLIILTKGQTIGRELVKGNLDLARESDAILTDHTPLTWDNLNRLRKQAAHRAARKIEGEFLKILLNKFNGNVTRAAKHLGVDRATLYRMLNRSKE